MKNIFCWRMLTVLFSAWMICLAAAGCATLEEEMDERPADITLDQLEKKMLKARDPNGVFLKAKSYVQKQIVTDIQTGEQQICEVRYLAPDRLNMLMRKDNQPDSAIIINGDSAWKVNYPERKVTPIVGMGLAQLKTMQRLGDPDDSYQDLFKKVDLSLCRIGENEYYKLVCHPKIRGSYRLILYVGRDSYLLHRIRIPALESETRVDRYALYEGVMVPEETISERSRSRVFYNRLNLPIDEQVFLPPVFSPAVE
ncbi:MAG: hypothetical protein IJV89_06795 [Lentisphaeria bacterium]|nr:hypothetical protein [Lentisphaeria bacterium]